MERVEKEKPRLPLKWAYLKADFLLRLDSRLSIYDSQSKSQSPGNI